MKQRHIKIAALCLIFVFISFSSAFSASNQINLKFANYFPPQSLQSKLIDDFIAELDQRTGGVIKTQHFPGGALAKAPQIIKSVEQGIADIGFSHISYTAGRFPVTEVCELPHGFPTGWVANQIMNDFYEKFKPKEWDSVVPMWFHSNTPSTLATNKAIRVMEDFKGMTIRAPGRMAAVISALGGTPAPTPIMESYDAVSKGVIQGIFVGGEGIKTFRFGEVVKFVTNSWNIGPNYPMYVVMNKRSYAKIPPELLPVFYKLCGEYKEKFALGWQAADFWGVEFGKSNGVEYIELGKEEFDRWIKAVQPVFDEYVKEMVGKGFKEEEVRGWISYLQERKNVLLEKQKELNIKSTTGPPEVR
jgi:TRAP-type C4-dicarboxylate transport system substrate-binding protein